MVTPADWRTGRRRGVAEQTGGVAEQTGRCRWADVQVSRRGAHEASASVTGSLPELSRPSPVNPSAPSGKGFEEPGSRCGATQGI